MKIDNNNLFPAVSNPVKSTWTNPGSNAVSNRSDVADLVSLGSPGQRSRHVLEYSLSQNLKINQSTYQGPQNQSVTTDSESDNSDSSLFDYQAVADSVLSFVTRALKARQQAGDDPERLQSLMSQARSGIDQGFAAAGQELKQQGLLNDVIQKGMDKSYDVIGNGLTSLDEHIAAGETIPAYVPPQKIQSAQQGNTQSASLTLTTKEGDKITIQFDQQLSSSRQSSGTPVSLAMQSYARMRQAAQQSIQSNEQNQGGQKFSFQASQSYSYTVEGNLSDAEKASLGDVFKQIGSLSDQFFKGNIQAAVSQAESLDLSDTEWGSLSLQLMQRQEQSGTTSNDPADWTGLTDNQKAALQLPDTFSQLGQYMKQLQSLLKTVMGELTPDSQQTLQQWVVNQQTPDQSADQVGAFTSFNQRLSETLAQLQGS